MAGLQTLTTAQQADLIEQDCLQDAASSIRGAPGKDEAAKPKVCAWVRQTFLDLSSQSPRVSGNMLCAQPLQPTLH